MAKAAIINATGVNEQMLAPHLRNKRPNVGNNTNISTKVYIKKQGIAGEAIEVGQLIYRGSDLKWYLADKTSHPAEMVALTSAIANGTFDYSNDEDVTITSPTTAYGDKLLLNTSGGVRVATEPAENEYWQVVGNSFGNNLIHINIRQAYFVEPE